MAEQAEIDQAILAVSSAYQNAEDGQRIYKSEMIVWQFEETSFDLEHAAIRLREQEGPDGQGVQQAYAAYWKASIIYNAVKRYHVDHCGGRYDPM